MSTSLPAELRHVAPEAFVAARDELARTLRRAGERERAETVRRLRRPSAPLWAANGLAEAAPEQVAALIDAGRTLREATQAALGGQRTDLARLSTKHARLLDAAAARAAELLLASGGADTRDGRARIWALLRTASLDPDSAALLREGALATEPASAGFDDLAGFGFGVPAPVAEPVPTEVPAPAGPLRRSAKRGGQVEPATPHPKRGGAPEPAHEAGVEAQHEREARLRERTAALDERLAVARDAARRLAAVRGQVAELRGQLTRAEREERHLALSADEADRAAQAIREELEALRS